MARTITAPERSYTAGLRPWCHAKFEVQDADGLYRDYTQYLRTDWFTGASISESIDQSTITLNATLQREVGTLSLSPFRSDSLINRNSINGFATALDAWRKWRLSVAVTLEGYPPTGTDWKEMCQGRIDVIEWSGDQIIITGRGEEAVLLDFWIAAERQYGSIGGIAMETVLQSMIDDNLSAGIYPVFTPVSPSYLMLTWTQQKGNLFPGLTAVADKTGAILRMRYDSSNVQRLTLFLPNRVAVPGDEVWTIGASEITGYQKVAVDKLSIRNFIKIRFAHPTLGTQTVISPWQAGVGTVSCTAGVATFSNSQAGIIKTTGSKTEIIVAGIAYTVNTFNGTTGATLISQLASGGVPTFSASAFTLSDTVSGSGSGSTASIDRFGRTDLELDLAFTSQVTDPTKAQAMADFVRSDNEFSKLEQQFEAIGLWFVQLHDFGKFLANGIHYDQDQYGGVTSIRHDIANGTIKSTIGVRDKPSGKYSGWRYIQGANGSASLPQLQFAECLTTITNTTATTVEVTVTANPASPPQQVQLVGILGAATLNSGVPAGTWVTPNGTNNRWVFNRAALNAGVGQVQFRAGNTSSFPNDDKFVTIEEQGRDTVYLAARARVISNTASTLVVRVAVADPYPQGANSATINWVDLGSGGVTPATGQTVTPAATLTEVAGSYVDYTITRPAFGAGAGRVTFTATAAGRTTDSDAVDIPEVDRDTVALAMRARVTATTPTTLTVRVAVADPYPQGAASVSIATQDLGVGSATSPSSPQTVTPAATLTEAAGTFVDYTVTRPAFGAGAGRVTFTATNANRLSSSDAVDVPEVDRDTVALNTRARVTATTATTMTVRVAVADPYPQGAASVSIATQDLGVGAATTPASPQTVTPASTLTEAAGTFVDYTVTRPAFGAGAGRVTFTATNANRTSSSDAIDVPEINSDFTQASLIASANVSIQGTTAVRTSGTGWTEQVYSKDGCTGGAFASAVASATNAFGLNTDPTTDASYTSIDYAIMIDTPSYFHAFENGVDQGSLGSWSAGDVMSIVYDGSSVRYMQNGTVRRTVLVAPALTFFFDSSIWTGSLKNIRFGPLTNVGPTSGLPVPASTAIFSFNSGGTANGKMWIALTWGAISITKPDGTVISIPASSALATPPAPTLSTVVSGALGARTLYVRIGYIKNNIMVKVGAENPVGFAVPANSVLKVTSPAAVAGYDTWVALVGSSPNGEFIQAGSNFGVDWQESNAGFNSATTVAFDPTYMPSGVTAYALQASSTYWFYPYYDILLGFAAFDSGSLNKNNVGAQTQNADGRIPLSSGGASAITPAAAGTASGTTPTLGRLL